MKRGAAQNGTSGGNDKATSADSVAEYKTQYHCSDKFG